MKRTLFLILVLYFFTIPQVNAWEPCLPFCDAECSGQAMTNLAKQTVNALGAVSTTCSKLTASRYNTVEAITNSFSNMSSNVTSYHQNVLSSMDAMTLKLIHSNTSQTIAFSNLTDGINNSLWEAGANSSKMRQFFKTRDRFNDHSRSNNPLLIMNACEDCTDEPAKVVVKRLEKLAINQANFATIVAEGISNRSQTMKDKESLLNFQKGNQHFLAFPNSGWESKNTLAKAISFQNINRFDESSLGKLRSELFALTLAKFHSVFSFSDEDGYSNLNAYTTKNQSSVDSLLRGVELDALLSPTMISEISSLNAHGLSHRLILSKQVETTQYHTLQQLTAIKNVLMALDIANEKFN